MAKDFYCIFCGSMPGKPCGPLCWVNAPDIVAKRGRKKKEDNE